MNKRKFRAQVQNKISLLVESLSLPETNIEATLNQIKTLNETLETIDNGGKLTDILSVDTLVKSGVSIAGLLMILKYEQTDIITTKGLDFVKRLLP